MEVFQNKQCLQSDEEYLHSCFKVIDQQITLAEVTLYINAFHKIQDEQACAIGHFRCVNDPNVFKLLMDAVVKEVKNLNHRWIIGPLNGSTWNEYRLVTSGFDKRFLLDVHTPEYHVDLFRSYGFEELTQYLSTYAEQIVVHEEKIEAAKTHFIKEGIIFEPFKIDKAEEEFKKLATLCNEAFSDNFLFSPLTEERFVEKMMPTLDLIKTGYTFLARKGNRTVGFIFCYPDLMDKTRKTIVVKTLARAPEKAYQGIGSVLSSMAMKKAKVDGLTKGIHALMVISNSSTYISKKFEANLLKTYALMSLEID